METHINRGGGGISGGKLSVTNSVVVHSRGFACRECVKMLSINWQTVLRRMNVSSVLKLTPLRLRSTGYEFRSWSTVVWHFFFFRQIWETRDDSVEYTVYASFCSTSCLHASLSAECTHFLSCQSFTRYSAAVPSLFCHTGRFNVRHYFQRPNFKAGSIQQQKYDMACMKTVVFAKIIINMAAW